MNDFLQFLNTASAESLTKTPGISPALAENLIAARPFENVEDCLKVRGMGRNLLARAQASFEKAEAGMIPEEHALVPTEEPEARVIVPAEISPPKQEPQPTPGAPSIGSRLGQAVLWFFRALLRLILIVLVIGGVGAAIYYGAPLVNEKFVAPVEQNAARVSELQNEIDTLETQLTGINEQLISANEQLATLNNQLDETNSRIDDIERSVQAHTASLETLADMQTALETQLKETNDKTLLALKHEVMLTRALDTLARARLYLAQSNFGLAKADVQSARDLLAGLQEEAENEVQAQAIERLDMALANLPDFPVVASGDLEITWQILMSGKTVPTATPEPSPTTTVTPQGTVEATPTVTATP
jgi:cell division protein FtsB